MKKKQTPKELASSLRNECKSTVGVVRYSTALNAAKALDALSADSIRLEWLLRNVSGEEFRRLGIVYSAGCQRADIDLAMCEEDAA